MNKRSKLIGEFVRKHREAKGLSQRALGLLFNPAVTTQFVSNVERGVTPLPPVHIPVLAKALSVDEMEMMALLEQEYVRKLSGRLGSLKTGVPQSMPPLVIASPDYDFIRNLYDAYRLADQSTRQAFATVCESVLKIQKSRMKI